MPKFGSSLDVLGKSIILDGTSFTVVGLISATFNLEVPSFSAGDVYAPVRQWGNTSLRNRKAALGLHGIGRLKPGITLEQAKVDLQAVAANLARAFPDANKGTSANILPMKQTMVGDIQP